MSKYAPANEAGDKPYVVELSDWGRQITLVVYAESVGDARYRAGGRRRVGRYVTKARRATPDDLASEGGTDD